MLLLACLLLAFLSAFPTLPSAQQLTPSFYSSSCPNVVSTVSNTFLAISKKDNVVAPSTLRLILHDCFVQGCDASILLSSTSGNQAERSAPDNQNLPQNAFDAISKAKEAVEAICPGVVSCADVLALAARDAVVFLGGPTWEVPLGRRDGIESKASDVAGRIPGGSFDATQLEANFGAQGLNLQDVVILTGAHTIGFTHCSAFSSRLYSFNSSVAVDPSINPTFVPQLKQKCVQNGANNLQALDVTTPFAFDNQFYKDLQAGKGILFSDQVLFQDPRTQALVNSFAGAQDQFFRSFTASMIKMTSTGVKVGNEGEIRKVCSTVNPNNGTPAKPPTPGFGSPPNAPPQSNNTPIGTPNVPSPSPIAANPPPSFPPPTVLPPPPPKLPAPTVSPPFTALPPPPPKLPPPTVSPPPTALRPPLPNLPPPTVIPPPSFPPPSVLPTPPPILPPPPVVPANPPPIPSSPTIPSTNPTTPPFTPPPSPGFTIPGIPGFSPPFSIPRFRIPGFRRPPPSMQQTSTRGTEADNGKSETNINQGN